MVAAPEKRLKLRARDSEDFRVISALLQDAIVPLADVSYLAKPKRFILLANRFVWEKAAREGRVGAEPGSAPVDPRESVEGDDAKFAEVADRVFERTHCGVCFDRVTGVRRRNIEPRQTSRILNLLAVQKDDRGVTLSFSEDAALRLEGRRVVCHLEDLGEAWPTRWQPAHDLED